MNSSVQTGFEALDIILLIGAQAVLATEYARQRLGELLRERFKFGGDRTGNRSQLGDCETRFGRSDVPKSPVSLKNEVIFPKTEVAL